MATRRQDFLRATKPEMRKKAVYPIISSDVMGNRNVEVVPVGAWVEPADDEIQPDAVIAAQFEEEKIRRLQEEKENRIRTFRKQTKQRVSQASRMKRHQQIQEAEKAFELERRVVQQSCLTADMARRDTCMHRQDLDLEIRNRLLMKYGEDVSTWGTKTINFESQSLETHHETDKARQQLISKKISQQDSPVFEQGCQPPQISRGIQEPTVMSGSRLEDLPTSKQSTMSEDQDGTISDNEAPCDSDQSDGEEKEASEEKDSRRTVQFTEPSTQDKERRKKRRPVSGKRPQSARLSAVLTKDAENDALARQRRQQAAVSRRIFMDREREAVRENLRREEHRKKIASLKREKEQVRQELETMAYRQVEPVDPATGETANERRMREKMEALEVKDMVDKRADDLRRAREMERYLSALKHSLIEKVTRQGIQLPSLCACSDTIWDTHPETCANNCFFYRNPRAYARALQSLLSSADLI